MSTENQVLFLLGKLAGLRTCHALIKSYASYEKVMTKEALPFLKDSSWDTSLNEFKGKADSFLVHKNNYLLLKTILEEIYNEITNLEESKNELEKGNTN